MKDLSGIKEVILKKNKKVNLTANKWKKEVNKFTPLKKGTNSMIQVFTFPRTNKWTLGTAQKNKVVTIGQVLIEKEAIEKVAIVREVIDKKAIKVETRNRVKVEIKINGPRDRKKSLLIQAFLNLTKDW